MSITFLFCDVEDSTGLLTRLGDEYLNVLGDVRKLVRAAVSGAGGHEIECRGDEAFCIFDVPANAATAAIEMQRGFASHEWPRGEHVRIRLGLHTGEAERSGSSYVGIDVHRAARICQAAHGGQVLASEEAARSLGPIACALGDYQFHGLRDPERVY